MFKTLLTTILFSFVISSSALAYEVISVGDGDTITVLNNGQKSRVRFACLDAPESSQKGGKASTNRLKQLIPVGTKVDLDIVDTDRYGRLVGVVSKGNLNINLTMVREGQAVVYRKYLSNCPNAQQYIEAENTAKEGKKAFWGISDRIMPCCGLSVG